jgi:hypothetical protein
MSASQRTKGAQGEREWCDYLRKHAGLNAKRVLGQARDSGGDVALPPVLYEVKRRHEIHIRKFLDQAVNALPQYKGCKLPVVALREDGRTDWMVLMRADDFLALLNTGAWKNDIGELM